MQYKFEWTKEMSVGEEHIDSQHQHLLAQLNKVIDDLVNQKIDNTVLLEILSFFNDYINDHLAYEEKYMENIQYPYIAEHKEKHHDFIKYFTEYREKVAAGVNKDILLAEAEKYIGEWWINHIGNVDKQYYLFAKGESPKN